MPVKSKSLNVTEFIAFKDLPKNLDSTDGLAANVAIFLTLLRVEIQSNTRVGRHLSHKTQGK